MTNQLRPDEQAAYSEIERSQSRDRGLKKAIKTGIAIAGTAGTAASIPSKAAMALGSRIMPFLNEHVPIDLAMKGIDKVSPRVGEFLRKGQSKGLDIKEGLNFIKEQISPQNEPAKENRNVIQKYSPELHEFLNEEIRNGRSAIEAGAIAQNDKRFSNIIKKISIDHKTPWSNILESVYGGQGQGLPQSQPMQQQGSSQQSGQGQQALMAILEKLNQARGMR